MRRIDELSRRGLLGIAAGLAATRVASAAALLPTPRQTLGPFYPTELPLDRDNDLLLVNGQPGTALGTPPHVFGRVLDPTGRPVRNALVEIWQCDANGRYHHAGDGRRVSLDRNFQGYGQFTTGDDGAYRFRTIRPVAYPGRTPHIHFAIRGPGFERLVTQMYVAGELGNERDGVLNAIRDERQRRQVTVSLAAASDLEPGALRGEFEIVLG